MDEIDYSRNDEISLLDLLVVIAENLKVLVGAPIAAGVIAYSIMYAVKPLEFKSQAIVRADMYQISALQAAQVLDDPLRQSVLFTRNNNSIQAARRSLFKALTIDPVDGAGVYRVTLTLDDAEEAYRLLTQILKKLIEKSEPVGNYRSSRELQLETQRIAVEDLKAALTRLNESYSRLLTIGDGQAPLIQGELRQSLGSLISNIESKCQEIASAAQKLPGALSQYDVIQVPTLPDSPEPRGLSMISAVVVVIVGFLALIGAFAREGLRRASASPDGSAKVARIRRALWLDRKKT